MTQAKGQEASSIEGSDMQIAQTQQGKAGTQSSENSIRTAAIKHIRAR